MPNWDRSGAARGLAVVLLAISPWIASPSARAQDGVDPEAERLLRSMSDYLGHLTSLSATFEDDTEVLTWEGQKLQLGSSGTLLLERPGRLRVARAGAVADGGVLVADGKMVTVFSAPLHAWAELHSDGTIDATLEAVRAETGVEAAGGDLFYADAYPGLMTEVTEGANLGIETVRGIECGHLAFRAKVVDWQIWIATGDAPLPMKYVITSKWTTGAPQYSIRLHDWQSNPKFDAEEFRFVPPEGAKRVDRIFLDASNRLATGDAP